MEDSNFNENFSDGLKPPTRILSYMNYRVLDLALFIRWCYVLKDLYNYDILPRKLTPEDQWLENEIAFEMLIFLGGHVNVRGGYSYVVYFICTYKDFF